MARDLKIREARELPRREGAPYIEAPYLQPSRPARILNVVLRSALKPLNRGLMYISPTYGLRISSKILGLTAPEPCRHRKRRQRCKLAGVDCDILQPATGDLRCTVLYLHGGGFVSHVPSMYRRWGRLLAKRLHAEVVIPDYRLAPQHRYPAAGEDCLNVYEALLAQGRTPAQIVLMGDSAGGNLVLTTLLRLRDADSPLPACAIPISPATDLRHCSGSLRCNERHDPMVAADLLPRLVRYYVHASDVEHHYGVLGTFRPEVTLIAVALTS